MGPDLRVYGVTTSNLYVPPGATLAVLMTGGDGVVGSTVKYFAGGSLEVFQCPVGTTAPGGSLAALIGTGYLFDQGEAMNFDGPARYYLMATGATAQCMVLKGLSSGN